MSAVAAASFRIKPSRPLRALTSVFAVSTATTLPWSVFTVMVSPARPMMIPSSFAFCPREIGSADVTATAARVPAASSEAARRAKRFMACLLAGVGGRRCTLRAVMPCDPAFRRSPLLERVVGGRPHRPAVASALRQPTGAHVEMLAPCGGPECARRMQP